METTETAEKTIWLNYDLGVGGDFQGLYSWFDDHKAIECGNNTAYLKYIFPDTIKTDQDFTQRLVQDLPEKVQFTPANRVYIVRKSLTTDKTIGTFIIGKRKANSWEGFGSKTDNTIDE
ncbi:MAG: hypothetical protein LBT50_05320 [Prevotellaceae bacterium]|jgi:hypothetical protein|nr:hypothetical protein [Prevotellaceae bacterium]